MCLTRMIPSQVVDESNVNALPDLASVRAHIVKAEWFWTSVQNEGAADEKEYLFEDVRFLLLIYSVFWNLLHLLKIFIHSLFITVFGISFIANRVCEKRQPASCHTDYSVNETKTQTSRGNAF